MTGRMPASVTASLALHAGGFVLFLGLVKQAPKEAGKVVEGVDLLISSPKPAADALPKPKPPPLSTMDFLKLALPNRPAGPAAMSLKLPETRKAMTVEAPKLEERAKRDLGPKLEALDLSRERGPSAAKIEAKVEGRRSAAQTLAAMPRLEEVGRRRVANLPQALALEESRREAVAQVGMGQIAPVSRRQAVAAMATLKEAEPAAGGARERASGLAALLPENKLELGRSAPAAAPMARVVAAPPKLERRVAQAAQAGASRKGVEIEGPLKDRKVVAHLIPAFPEWAKTQGILEAEVAIRFTVDADGRVMDGMRVERTSGYGRLDRLTMDALKEWKFAPAPGSGAQWGVITFRYILE